MPNKSKLTKKTVPRGCHEVGAQYVDALTCQHALVDKWNIPGERITTLEGKGYGPMFLDIFEVFGVSDIHFKFNLRCEINMLLWSMEYSRW